MPRSSRSFRRSSGWPKAAKEPRELGASDRSEVEKAVMEVGEADLRAVYSLTQKQERYAAVDAVKAKVFAALAPDGAEAEVPPGKSGGVPQGPGQGRPLEYSRPQAPYRRARSDHRAPDPGRGRGAAPHPWLELCSRAAKRRRWPWPRSARRRRAICRFARTAPTRSGSCCTTTSHPIRSARPAAWARLAEGNRSWQARLASHPPMLPTPAEFPYTIPKSFSRDHRVERLIVHGDVCGSSLALMDAGVPLKRPTAGIAMGLILEGSRFAVLSDILGDEDHLGDMDFKVAGTSEGVTSLQMDIKIAGITEEIMRQALAQARDGRMHILGEMSKAITGARAELGEFAPRIETMKIPTDKIREVIGSGGKVIREIVEKTAPRSTSRMTAR